MTGEPLTSSAYVRAILEMNELPSDIVDSHAHMGPVRYHHMPGGSDAATIVASMDHTGVSKSCFSHHLVVTGDLAEGNRRAVEAAEAHPGRFYVYLGYNPNYPEQYLIEMLDRYVANPFVIGLKFHTTTHQASPDDERYRPGYEYASSHGLAVLSHIWGVSEVNAFAQAARDFPSVPFLFGHSGGYDFAANARAMEVSRELPNAFLDLCLSGMFEGVVEYFVEHAGEDKVLYGSDVPFMDSRANIGRVAFADITDAAKEKVLGSNMESIIEQCRRKNDG